MIKEGKLALDTLVHQLIWENDCIILPGFGAIITRENQAGLNPATHTFRPKGKTIFFNPTICQTDGLLANTLTEQLGLSYADANIMIETALQALKEEINQGKKMVWNGIGVFFGNNDKTFFIPETEANFLMESFGLPLVKLKPIAAKETKKTALEKEELKEEMEVAYVNKYKETALVPNFEKPAALIDERKKRGIFKWFAAACIAGVFIYVGVQNQSKVLENTAEANFVQLEMPLEGEVKTQTESLTEPKSEGFFDNNNPAENNAIAAPSREISTAVTERNENTSITEIKTETIVEASSLMVNYNLADRYHIVVAKSLNPLFPEANQYKILIANSFITRIGMASSNDETEINNHLINLKKQYPNAEILDQSAYKNL